MAARQRKSAVTWLMPLGTTIQFFLPRWVMVIIARIAGRLICRFSPRRQLLIENYRHILGPQASAATLNRTACRAFVNLVTNYFDLLRSPVLKQRVVAMFELRHAQLDRALEPGRGAILVTAHLGNWDLAGVCLTAEGYPLAAAVEPIPAGWSRTFNRYRAVSGLETIPITDGRGFNRAIRRHRLLTLVADRDLTGRGILCPSFDAQRSFPKGPAAFALKYNLPVVLGYMVFQNRPGRPPYLGIIEPAFEFKPTGNRTRDIEKFTQLIARRINNAISRYPDQWLVFRAGWQ